MFTILKAYEIPDELMTAIFIMYEDTIAKIITPDENGKFHNSNWCLTRIYVSSIPFYYSYRLCYENSFTRKGR